VREWRERGRNRRRKGEVKKGEGKGMYGKCGEGSGVERCWEVHVEEERGRRREKGALDVIHCAGHVMASVVCSVTICDPSHAFSC